ncbi:MAG: hypothetical protein KAI79_08320 [Bacteroidales bacterium]|nr:hypothetical protein [Bacteroidales bacterium]
MVSIENEKVFNDTNPWQQIILKDILTGVIYEVFMDTDDDIYLEVSVGLPTSVDIEDISSSLIYQLFSYNQQVYIAPTATSSGTIYATECFIAVGNTIIMKIDRTSTTITDLDDISVHIYDQTFDAFIFIDTYISEISENSFKIEFITPINGDFIAIIKVGDSIHLVKPLKVEQYSYDELNRVINTAKNELDTSKYEVYI